MVVVYCLLSIGRRWSSACVAHGATSVPRQRESKRMVETTRSWTTARGSLACSSRARWIFVGQFKIPQKSSAKISRADAGTSCFFALSEGDNRGLKLIEKTIKKPSIHAASGLGMCFFFFFCTRCTSVELFVANAAIIAKPNDTLWFSLGYAHDVVLMSLCMYALEYSLCTYSSKYSSTCVGAWK